MASFEEAVKKYPEQFSYESDIQNTAPVGFNKFVIAGMGGSGLAAGIIKALKPELDIIEHRDYALPAEVLTKAGVAADTLFIAVSYSGNTKETIDFFNQAQSRGLNVAVVTTGGELLKLAKEKGVPYVQIPDIGVPARMAVGLMVRATLKLMGEEMLLNELKDLSTSLDPMRWENKGKYLADQLFNKAAIIYASTRNQALAYNWKIRLNETGKTLAFYNVLPELAHNEIAALADKPYTAYIFLKDDEDDPRVKKAMDYLEKRYFWGEAAPLEGESRPVRFFNSVLLADWTGFYSSERLGIAWDDATLIEEFKKLNYGEG
ncbi:MAG: hypothetical protein HYS89_02230 [Candidatus Colwellbacteria bacterium]|nr:hypothetical protein [Candidatus Colwellbacteria bacterium]